MCKLFSRPDRNIEAELKHCLEVQRLQAAERVALGIADEAQRELKRYKEQHEITNEDANGAFLRGFQAGLDKNYDLAGRIMRAEIGLEEI